MCTDIDYCAQSLAVHRLNQLLGNGGKHYLDMACGTGPHIAHFMALGYAATGVDINQPMLDLAQARCPGARFLQQDMSELGETGMQDLISCFLYSIHYNQSLARLQQCIAGVHASLNAGGVFCFNSVDKNLIDNRPGVKHYQQVDGSDFSFQSNWYYPGEGEQQQLQLCIEKTTRGQTETWHDHHPMVALSFVQMRELLEPFFEVHAFEHDYSSIQPWRGQSGNALFVAIKKTA